MDSWDSAGFAAAKIIITPYLTQDGEPQTRRRSIWERLFSRPWRPLVATETYIPSIPYKGVIQTGTNQYIMHPETYDKLKKELEGQK